jgi:hypothetical protein
VRRPYRIKLIRTGEEDRQYLEWSEGPLYGPMLATDLKIEAESGKISFTISAIARRPNLNIFDSRTLRGGI